MLLSEEIDIVLRDTTREIHLKKKKKKKKKELARIGA